jgi:hypothetical protein
MIESTQFALNWSCRSSNSQVINCYILWADVARMSYPKGGCTFVLSQITLKYNFYNAQHSFDITIDVPTLYVF